MNKKPTAKGELLRKLRLERGLTQAELGKLAGVSNMAVSCIETGYVKHPREFVWRRLMNALTARRGSTPVPVTASKIKLAADVAPETSTTFYVQERCKTPKWRVIQVIQGGTLEAAITWLEAYRTDPLARLFYPPISAWQFRILEKTVRRHYMTTPRHHPADPSGDSAEGA
jgi:transcriptional regulator with XRE-family HTH domain